MVYVAGQTTPCMGWGCQCVCMYHWLIDLCCKWLSSPLWSCCCFPKHGQCGEATHTVVYLSVSMVMLWYGAFMQYIIEKWLYTFVLHIVTSVVRISYSTHTSHHRVLSRKNWPPPSWAALGAVLFAVILVLAVAIFTIVLLYTSESDVMYNTLKSACVCKCVTLKKVMPLSYHSWTCTTEIKINVKAACRYKGPL